MDLYKKTQITTASSGKLIVMLYDEVLRQIKSSIHELEAEKPRYDTINNSLTRAHNIITELIAALDMKSGGELATNLFNIYIYINKQITNANMKKSKEPLQESIPLIEELRDAWQQIADTPHAAQDDSARLDISG